MSNLLLVILIGLAGGIAVGLQAPLASFLSQRLGTLESAFIVHLGGAMAALLPLLFLGGGNLGDWRSAPWYTLIAGAFGVVVLGAISFTILRVGVAVAFMLIVAGQLAVAAALDHFGLLGAEVRRLDWARLVGLLVVLGGTWLVMRR